MPCAADIRSVTSALFKLLEHQSDITHFGPIASHCRGIKRAGATKQVDDTHYLLPFPSQPHVDMYRVAMRRGRTLCSDLASNKPETS